MLKRAFCLFLAVLHLATFGPVKEAFAYSATSTSYNLTTGSPSQGGAQRGPAGTNILNDSIGEPSAGNSSSTSYLLSSGFIPTLQSNPPEAKHIPAQFWQKNTEKKDAFDLDDYFSSPDGYTLTYAYKKLAADPKINITIDPATHLVSFSQPKDYSGTEKVKFIATDSEGNEVSSNKVPLQVLGEKNQPVINQITVGSAVARAGDLVTITVKAIDMDGDVLVFTHTPDNSDFFNFTASSEQNSDDHNLWTYQIKWQPDARHQGSYSIVVKVTDPTGLFDTAAVELRIGINNHKPIIKKINGVAVNPGEPVNLTAAESETFVLKVEAEDPDNNMITLSYFWPFDNPQGSEGKWVNIAYDVARPEPYVIQVVASDRIDTDSVDVLLTVTNKNRKPFIEELSVSPSTLLKNQQATISLKGSDQDADNITFILKKGAEVIASGPLESAGISANLSFSEEGSYQITALVTDGVDTTTLQRNVQVTHVDYNINPIMGDFNGDSRTDLGIQNYNDGTWQVSLSSLDDKGAFSFGAFSDPWASDFGASRDWLPVGGDFNGDGKSDIGIYNSVTGELKIAKSTGTGFTPSGTWFNFPEASTTKRYCQTQEVCSGFWIFESCENVESCADYPYSPWQPFTGNFNADKYTDFALYNRDSGQVKIVLGNGSVFKNEDLSVWLDAADSHKDYTALAGDFNGDSLADLLLFKKATGEIKVLFSNTKKFVDEADCTPAGFSAKDKDLILSDFNNDGLTDIGYWDKESSKWYYAISNGEKFVYKGTWLESFGTSETDSAVTGDFDGNGITDAAIFDKDQPGMECWQAHASTNKPADLLINIANGIGGQTKVEYSFSGLTEQDYLPFPVYIAKRISSINNFPDERRAVYTQSFDFTGGFFDAAEREFRGFRKVKATDPITKNYSVTNFNQGREDLKQDGALKGQIEKIESYDGNNHLISRAVNTYTVTKEGREGGAYLGFPALTDQLTTVNEENNQYITTKNTFSYDAIGNPLEQSNDLVEYSGLSFKPGSKKATQTTYAQAYTYNTDIGSGLNRPLATFLKDKDNNIVSEKRFAYDGKGNLSREQVVIINPITRQRSNAFTRYSYDDFGNLTTTTNARGYKVTTEYETKFSTYPAKVTNALGQSISYTYDYKLGVVTSVTDANHATTTSFYDSLGRLLYTQNTLGEVPTRYEYPDKDFNHKYTKQLKPETGEYVTVKTDFIDGLGRKYKTISVGEDGAGARDVISEVFYNERGFVDRESLPHYVGEDVGQIAYTRYVYDIRGRVKQTIADFAPSEAVPTDQYRASDKDANGFIYYGPNDSSPLYTETQDPLGHRKGSLKDIYGNVLEVTEFTDKGNFKTKYEYDLQNNLVKVTDSHGQDAFTRGKAPNVTQIFYDSIGRKIKMIDPDMGQWQYEYDSLGNLIRQTDAKGQVIEFIYDHLNRLIIKQGLSPKGTVPALPMTLSKRISNFFLSEAYANSEAQWGLSPQGTVPIVLATYLYDDPRKPNCIGRLSKVIDQSGSTEFFYDELGREIKSIKTVNGVIASPGGSSVIASPTDPSVIARSEATKQSFIVQRQYDQFDRLTKLTYPDGEAVNYTYDTNSGLLEKVFTTDSGLRTMFLTSPTTPKAKLTPFNTAITLPPNMSTDRTCAYQTSLRRKREEGRSCRN